MGASGLTSRDRTKPPVIDVGEIQVEDGGTGVRVEVNSERGALPAPNTLPAPVGPFVGRDSELRAIAQAFADHRRHVLILWGLSGVGKSELARRFGRLHREQYPGGVFNVRLAADGLPVDLARIGCHELRITDDGDSLQYQCEHTLAHLGREQPTLLIYDNVESKEHLLAWLPRSGQSCHVLVTTTIDYWSETDWHGFPVEPLSNVSADLLIRELIPDEAVVEQHREQLLARGGGLPVQLCADARSVKRAAHRGRVARLPSLAGDTRTSFDQPWQALDDDARLALRIAALFEPARIPEALVIERLQMLDWSNERCEEVIDQCKERLLLQAGLRMHSLVAVFVRAQTVPEVPATLLDAHRDAWVQAARRFVDSPGDSALLDQLVRYPTDVETWQSIGEFSAQAMLMAEALHESGQFRAALDWALLAKEHASSSESLGGSLHQVGYCYSEQGQYEQARPWYEQAVETARAGDNHGRIDHSSLGGSLHQVGSCYSQQGQYEQARPWYEQAVEAARAGDIHGRIDHESLGGSLHQVGSCYSQQGQYEQARPWYEQAVEAARAGDIHGRIDHSSLGGSLHQVGSCYSQQGDCQRAIASFRAALGAAMKGNRFGQIDEQLVETVRRSEASAVLMLGD